MPVHPAGPRLYRSIKFKYLVRGAGSATHGRSSNISLNLTPFVDMMTILVTFLMMVFSASGELKEKHPAPADAPTRVAFGDPDLGSLYVTTEGGHLYRSKDTGLKGAKR